MGLVKDFSGTGRKKSIKTTTDHRVTGKGEGVCDKEVQKLC